MLEVLARTARGARHDEDSGGERLEQAERGTLPADRWGDQHVFGTEQGGNVVATRQLSEPVDAFEHTELPCQLTNLLVIVSIVERTGDRERHALLRVGERSNGYVEAFRRVDTSRKEKALGGRARRLRSPRANPFDVDARRQSALVTCNPTGARVLVAYPAARKAHDALLGDRRRSKLEPARCQAGGRLTGARGEKPIELAPRQECRPTGALVEHPPVVQHVDDGNARAMDEC